MNSLPPHWLEIEFSARQKEGPRFNDRSGEETEEETVKGWECLRQDAGDRTENGSELASKASKDSEAQPPESSDIAEITEKVGRLEVGQERLESCTGATKEDADGTGKSSLLDLYYGVSPTERELKAVNGMLFVHGSEY